MAKGIHASGDRKRKKLSSGKNALRPFTCWPSHKPAGIPNSAEIIKPIATRHIEAMISSINLPALNSSLKLAITAEGDGSAYDGKKFDMDTSCHISKATAKTIIGSNQVVSLLPGFLSATRVTGGVIICKLILGYTIAYSPQGSEDKYLSLYSDYTGRCENIKQKF